MFSSFWFCTKKKTSEKVLFEPVTVCKLNFQNKKRCNKKLQIKTNEKYSEIMNLISHLFSLHRVLQSSFLHFWSTIETLMQYYGLGLNRKLAEHVQSSITIP